MTHRPETASRDAGAAARLWRAALILQLILLAAEFVAGMAGNLYARIPAIHPGSVRAGTDYFTDLGRAEGWVTASGPPVLQFHVLLSLLIGVLAIALLVIAARAGGRGRAFVAWAGLVVIVGAGFNGGSFLIFGDGDRLASFAMALLFLLAVISYAAGLGSELRRRGRARPQEQQAEPDEYGIGGYEDDDDPPWREPAATEVAHEDKGHG
ncbi:MAG: hypothetical protein LBI49_16360 [Nocardiopsaceae bacterium]|jgi:hypothetical protein|nr:hypothetical protein [Nocardiopsaceae bacterium]